ncbi:MAG: fimbrial protein FimV [Pseudomonadota bacterium]|nr:fimbrial protein FimV [Pseudomonadota bacterium]
MNHRGRWRIGALASAIALLGSLASLEVHALALGRITVQSALGEPLRGEIEITDINPEEASSLKVGIASAETFRAAGLDYPSAASGLEVRLQRRADGRPYLRLNSNRAITEPFVDLILEANWSSGRITRDYTMLFDPPNLRPASTVAVAPTAPVLPRPTAPAPAVSSREMAPTPEETAATPLTRTAPVAKAAVPPPAPVQKTQVARTQVIVKRGDTATRIAAQNRPADVSLDQMLVALLRSNPGAFIGGNINVMKSGAVLNLPSPEAVSAIPHTEANRVIVAQSRDFNAFRRKLAESVAATEVASADRQAGGTLQAKVEDRALTNATPDKLTLSKGAVQGKPALTAEDKLAQAKEARDNASRVAELSKNISDLNKLATAPAGAAPAAAAPASKPAVLPVPAITVPTPASLAVPAQPGASSAVAAPIAAPALPGASAADAGTAGAVMAPASAASSVTPPLESASEPSLAASAAVVTPEPVAIPKPVVVPPPPPPPEEPGLVDQLLDNAMPLGAIALLALLGGFGFRFYRQKKKSKTAPVDSSFLESRLQPDSFFGASGGNRVNTNSENNITGSSMAYTPSQMDASGDVDPVAEADVYLAYGRDEQAEDILKEALHTYPARVAIHAKLLEIYAKRRDSKAFEKLAGEAFKLTQGQGPEWAYIIELGAELDPGNPLYRASGAVPEQDVASSLITASAVATPVLSARPAASASSVDMDFSPAAEAPQVRATPVATPAPLLPTAPPMVSPASATPPASALDDLDLGLDFDIAPPPASAAPAPAPTPPVAASAAVEPPPLEMDFLSKGLDFTPEPFTAAKPAPAPAPASAPAAAHDAGMMEFDLDALSLDLAAPPPPVSVQTEQEEDPLEIKFLLAEEFRSLGDTDGARSLADEVLAKARGPLKIKVQSFLNALS